MNISAGEFKAKCLKLMDEVNTYQEEIIITKHGKPVAKLVPYYEKTDSTPVYGYLKESVAYYGDITKPTGEQWHAE